LDQVAWTSSLISKANQHHDLEFRTDHTFLLLPSADNFPVQKSRNPRTCADRRTRNDGADDTTNPAATRTAAAGHGDDVVMGKSVRVSRRARIFKGLDLVETKNDFQSEGKRMPFSE
jgi:hypothetical protein